MMNKRGFLLGAASAVAAPQALAAAASPGCTTVAAHGQPLLTVGLRLAAWQAYLLQRFELSDGQRHWAVTLDLIKVFEASPGLLPTEQFVLNFANQGGTPIEGGLHRLQHPSGQSMLIHLSDNGSAGQQTLRAEFNLLAA